MTFARQGLLTFYLIILILFGAFAGFSTSIAFEEDAVDEVEFEEISGEEFVDADELDGSEDDEIDELLSMSLEELMEIEVTVASRAPQPMREIPAAVYVLTGDEIRRSGLGTLPDVLRMIPGFFVSRWTEGAWDVTARGFGEGTSYLNQAYLNQLLVMIDGVTVYTPLFAGVWWPLHDLDLDDIDRIEVIRGPGGVFWGSNTVHGVVHIITKSAGDTQGSKLSSRSSVDDYMLSARHGFTLGEDTYMRAWVKHSKHDSLYPSPLRSLDWYTTTVGFNADWEDEDGRQHQVWAKAYRGVFDNAVRAFDYTTYSYVYWNIHEWKRGGQLFWGMTDPEDDSSWQAWYSRDFQDVPVIERFDIHMIDAEYHRDVALSDNNRLTFGAGYRWTYSDLRGTRGWSWYNPRIVHSDTPRVFAVDTHSFPDYNTKLTFGMQVENNHYTGIEVQPSVRTTWSPHPSGLIWASVSRAVRTPSLEEMHYEDYYHLKNKDFKAETLIAYEIGTRWQIGEYANIDLAAFYNDYDEAQSIYVDPTTYIDYFDNDAEGKANGVELAVDLQPLENWRLRTAYAYLDGRFVDQSSKADHRTNTRAPRHLFNMRSYFDITDRLEFDAGVYLVEDFAEKHSDRDYMRGDARLGYHPTDDIEIAVGIQNMGSPHYSEYSDTSKIRRTLFLQLTYEF